MKKHLLRKTFLFTAVLLLTSSLTYVKAQFPGGTGTEDDPYIITTPAQLNEMRNSLSSYYKLGNDIELIDYLTGSEGWEPVGISDVPFSGGLDGDGHVITGFWINRPNTDNVGLFGVVLGTKIKNLGIVIPEGKEVKGQKSVGAIIGGTDYSSNKIQISECFVSGNVTATDENAGGIQGYSSNNGGVEIVDCYTTGKVSAKNKAGGLIGFGYRRILVSSCYSTATIVSSGGTGGGLIGEGGFPNGSEVRHDIEFSAAINPSISTTGEAEYVGRLVGYEKLNEGNGSGLYYYDLNYAYDQMQVNGAVVTNGTEENKQGVNKTADELKKAVTFFGEDDLYRYDDVWEAGNEAYSLPILKKLSKEYQPKVNPSFLGGPSSLNPNQADKMVVSVKAGNLTITGKTPGTLVSIYNLMGNNAMESVEAEINISSLAPGIYLVHMEGKTWKIVK